MNLFKQKPNIFMNELTTAPADDVKRGAIIYFDGGCNPTNLVLWVLVYTAISS